MKKQKVIILILLIALLIFLIFSTIAGKLIIETLYRGYVSISGESSNGIVLYALVPLGILLLVSFVCIPAALFIRFYKKYTTHREGKKISGVKEIIVFSAALVGVVLAVFLIKVAWNYDFLLSVNQDFAPLTTEERIETVKKHLHGHKSATGAKKLFPDFVEVFRDDKAIERGEFPERILPFIYYYSPSADITVNICEVDRTVFVCPGKLDRLIDVDLDDHCLITDIYKRTEREGLKSAANQELVDVPPQTNLQ